MGNLTKKSMSFFRYVQQGEGAPLRVADRSLDSYMADGFVEVTFEDWWDRGVADDTKERNSQEAPEGTFWAEVLDQDRNETVKLLCSLETGEPLDYAQAEEPVEEASSEEQAEESAEELAEEPVADEPSADGEASNE